MLALVPAWNEGSRIGPVVAAAGVHLPVLVVDDGSSDDTASVAEAAGASLDAVVRTTVYLVDLAEFPRMNEIYARHFRAEPPPARSTVQVSALPKGARVEIDSIATV